MNLIVAGYRTFTLFVNFYNFQRELHHFNNFFYEFYIKKYIFNFQVEFVGNIINDL